MSSFRRLYVAGQSRRYDDGRAGHLSTLDPKIKFEHGNRVIIIVEDGVWPRWMS
jgi:hypothetical protein